MDLTGKINVLEGFLADLVRERGFKLDSLQRSIKNSIEKGYDFGHPNASLYATVIQLESQIRELKSALTILKEK
jgi:hypothetical protein